jgi:predicted nucleotidyltransferase
MGVGLMDEPIRRMKIEAARGLAERFYQDGDVLAAYVSGSLLAGLGNQGSDVDLFCITTGGTERRPVSQHIVPRSSTDGETGAERVDVEFLLLTELERDIEAVTTYDVEFTRLPHTDPTSTQYDRAVRLLYSEPLFPSPTYDRLRDRVIAGETQLRKLLVTYATLGAFATQEDAYGAWMDGDEATSLYASQAAGFNAAQAFLAGCGDYYIGAKWAAAKLARLPTETLPLEWFLRILGVRADGAGLAWEALVRTRIFVAQAMLAAAATMGWDTADALRWDAWERVDGPGPVRSPAWMPLRVNDEVLLRSVEKRQLKIQPAALVLWGLCDGRDERELAAAVARLLPDLDDVHAEIDRLLPRMRELGLVQHDGEGAEDLVRPLAHPDGGRFA